MFEKDGVILYDGISLVVFEDMAQTHRALDKFLY